MKKITRTQLCNVSVPLPDRAMQDEISRNLDIRMNHALTIAAAAEAELAAIEALPAAILRKAFNGEL